MPLTLFTPTNKGIVPRRGDPCLGTDPALAGEVWSPVLAKRKSVEQTFLSVLSLSRMSDLLFYKVLDKVA